MTEGPGESTISTADAEPSLADDLGAMFGDFSGGESPESSSDQSAGAPPDSDDSASDPTAMFADGSEGAGTAEHAGTPPAVAAETSPDAHGQPSLDDPLKDAQPFTYTVNGQQRTADGIKRLGDHGAIVDAAYLPKLERIFTERDHLFEKSAQEYERRVALEKHYETLTAWPTKDAQGNQTVLTGPQGLEAQRTVLASALATQRVLTAVLDDPSRLLSLLAQDEAGNVVLDPRGKEHLDALLRAERMDAVGRTKEHFAGLVRQVPFAATPVQAPAPDVPVQQLALPTVEATLQSLNVTGLSPEDKAFLASQLPRYVRPTTPEERQLGHGSRIVDHEFTLLVQREAQRIANASKIATTATTTAQENAAKLAAAALGKRPVPPARPSNTPTPRAVPQSDTNRDAMWDRMERASAAAARRSA